MSLLVVFVAIISYVLGLNAGIERVTDQIVCALDEAGIETGGIEYAQNGSTLKILPPDPSLGDLFIEVTCP